MYRHTRRQSKTDRRRLLYLGLTKVGGTLDTSHLRTNFTSEKPAEFYAQLYREHNLTGAHVVMLGPGCEEAAIAAIKAWPSWFTVDEADCRRAASRWGGQPVECEAVD